MSGILPAPALSGATASAEVEVCEDVVSLPPPSPRTVSPMAVSPAVPTPPSLPMAGGALAPSSSIIHTDDNPSGTSASPPAVIPMDDAPTALVVLSNNLAPSSAIPLNGTDLTAVVLSNNPPSSHTGWGEPSGSPLVGWGTSSGRDSSAGWGDPADPPESALIPWDEDEEEFVDDDEDPYLVPYGVSLHPKDDRGTSYGRDAQGFPRPQTPEYAWGSTDPFYCDACAYASEPFPLLVGNPHANSRLALHSTEQLFDRLHRWTAEETCDCLALDCEDRSDELFCLCHEHINQVKGLEDALRKSKEDLVPSLEENARLSSTLDNTRQLCSTAMKMISNAQQLASQARLDTEHFHRDRDNWRSEYDYIHGHLHSSSDHTDPARAPSTMGAASMSLRLRPASSHETPDNHNVPMDDPIVKEPASAPPQPSTVAWQASRCGRAHLCTSAQSTVYIDGNGIFWCPHPEQVLQLGCVQCCWTASHSRPDNCHGNIWLLWSSYSFCVDSAQR
ncbi:hypothetical protein DACRYDRAFT_104481 [Dacryopinax primogenitus]|uniref:Uncharacterized protein n=1 Tax=Dacryopinax primogenitus (strain DJM 731) TaxID=1858805 RepID=M5G790_DACPD|nr:uncharacterized protein DACRYDRAFT_104481 [Dacryopinax primogenitus]EJU04599.1 hypothetical protein DACRYDRAFT_104481 [Dacryopinax primogenitus]